MVKKSILDEFVRRRGYDYVKRKRNRKWRGISEASKRTGLSRPTIYEILKEYPEPPSKTLPKYVEEFKDSEGYRAFKETFEKKLAPSTFQFHIKNLMTAFKKLDKKDPISWNKKDYKKIWNIEEFIVEIAPNVRAFEEHYASTFHKMMDLSDQHELTTEFKGEKMASGKKLHWFLFDNEIKRTAQCQTDIETLLFEFVGLASGPRSSAMRELLAKHIHFEDYTIEMYEPKMAKKGKPFVTKYPPLAVFRLLKRYIEDFNLQANDHLFPHSYMYYNQILNQVGKCAKLKKTFSTHILKHTFVSQGHRHGLSRETVVEMTGTEDRTIRKFYLSIDEKKIRHETQGLQLDVKPFWKWIEEDIAPIFEQRYMELVHPEEYLIPQKRIVTVS